VAGTPAASGSQPVLLSGYGSSTYDDLIFDLQGAGNTAVGLEAGDVLIVLGTDEAISRLRSGAA